MKYISVPINQDAMKRLDFDQSIDGDLVELTLDEKEYNLLNDTNIINILNTQLSKNIDDYEDEHITDINELQLAKQLIESKIEESNNEKLNQLMTLFDKAIDYQTGVFFFF